MEDGDYKINKHLTLRLKTAAIQGDENSPSKIFEDVFLPDVQVHIVEDNSLWKGRVCKSTSDPNMKTFDGKYYDCFERGTFILYRNEDYNQEVQEKHFSCYTGVTCNCAVAVRSGRDIFTIDICTNNRELINFPLCEDKVLRVTKLTDRRYMVLLPTGTIVMIKITSWREVWYLNVDITASPSDVNRTSGLCGSLDGNMDNDNMGRHKNKTDFPTSWQVDNTTENLFNQNNNQYNELQAISKTTALTRVCTCTNATTGIWRTICNYGTFKECKFATGKKFFCILDHEGSRRRKRDLAHLFSQTGFDESSNSGTLDRYKRQTVMSEGEARNTCLAEFEKSVAFQTCQKHISDLRRSSLTNCISDLKFTGDISFAAVHIEDAIEQCSTYIVLNSTFQQVEKEVTHQIQSLCPSNCSGNGVCIKGNCTCISRYAGSDCSFDLFGPPAISLISNFGFCDKSEEACDEITLYGRYFLENMNTRCFTTRQRITENGSYVELDYFEKKLEERTLFEGYCPLEYASTPTWVTYFIFNVSNDGRSFTENYNVYTYQSLCQEYHNKSGKISFTFKEGYCFVDGRCIADGKRNPKNKCDICNVAKDKYSWTFNEGHCYINGSCIKDGELNMKNPCEICIIEKSVTSWSINSEFCFINGVCYFDGERRKNSGCEICNINKTRNKWTVIEGGFCFINGSCVRDGEHAPQQECKVCNPASNMYEWHFDSAAGTYCIINGICVSKGERDTHKGCRICNPTLNYEDWSIEPGCSTSTELTTTESSRETTESPSFLTVAETSVSTKATTEAPKSVESSKTSVSTALWNESTALETTTANTTLHATRTDIIKETTTKRIESTATEKVTKSETTAGATTISKAKEKEQAYTEVTTMETIQDTLIVENTTLTKIQVDKTTTSVTNDPTVKAKLNYSVTTKTKTMKTTPSQTVEQTVSKLITNQVSDELTTRATPETKTEKPTVFTSIGKTTIPKTTTASSSSTESTHLLKFSEFLTSISTCCAMTTDDPKSPTPNAVRQYTLLVVSVAAPLAFVLLIMAIVGFIKCYRRSHATVILQSSDNADCKLDMKGHTWMRQMNKLSADEVFCDSEFGVSSSGDKYSKFSENNEPFS
ncbi:uncharacterized protein LOC134263057 isoform X2 [Saccostrea cucullata]|uniref:uncharacterized protein LOC134263057 isoform X2 n=1 Tax=Saccostrea cuccullata TaxID=36930 RepID=UPI002ED1C7E9